MHGAKPIFRLGMDYAGVQRELRVSALLALVSAADC